MPAATRARPEPAGEPAPVTIDPSPTPVEDVPEQATPAPEPADDEDGLPPIGAFRLTPEGAVPVDVSHALLPERTPADDLRDDHPLSAPEALAEVMRRVPAIAKGRTSDQGYRFRGIDDVYASLHDLFAEVGLVVLPRPVERIGEVRLVGKADNPRSQYVTHLLVEFRFLASDGTSETCSAWGEGSDMGDKATQKAHSQAMKSALLETFLIPTEESQRDEPDATNPDPGRAFTADEVERASRAWGAAFEAETVEQLAGIRQRALALLAVPVADDGGTIAPLGYRLDQRRAQIEGRS
jgi:hypothetical protein